MDEMNTLCSSSPNKDYVIVDCVGVEPIIVTTTAIQSIFPGVDLDNDAIDFCMQWRVLGILALRKNIRFA